RRAPPERPGARGTVQRRERPLPVGARARRGALHVRVIAALACLLAAGCSAPTAEQHAQGAASPAMVSAGAEAEPEVALAEHEEEILTLSEEIDQLSSALRCEDACDAGARLCALGERLCEIAERHPHDDEIAGRCADGRARCE